MSFHRPTRSLSVFREKYIFTADTCYCTKKVLHLSVIIKKESFIVVIKFGLSGLLSWSVSGYAHPGDRGGGDCHI